MEDAELYIFLITILILLALIPAIAHIARDIDEEARRDE